MKISFTKLLKITQVQTPWPDGLYSFALRSIQLTLPASQMEHEYTKLLNEDAQYRPLQSNNQIFNQY